MAISPASVGDHRRLTRLLTNKGEEYHTYSFQEDRLLRIIIRGIPCATPLEEVTEDLRSQGFAPANVARMTSKRTRQQMPLVLVQVPQDQVSILQITRCCSLVVRVEPQKATAVASQCRRCQKFGSAKVAAPRKVCEVRRKTPLGGLQETEGSAGQMRELRRPSPGELQGLPSGP